MRSSTCSVRPAWSGTGAARTARAGCPGTGANQFKVGPDAAGLLRPDKFVVYLRDAAELRAVAAELTRALAGARPHGVPFSAELAGDGHTVRVYDFLARAERLITPEPADAAEGGHGGGDAGLMDAFTAAVAAGRRELIKSGPRESLASHLAVFAAERARLNGTVEAV